MAQLYQSMSNVYVMLGPVFSMVHAVSLANSTQLASYVSASRSVQNFQFIHPIQFFLKVKALKVPTFIYPSQATYEETRTAEVYNVKWRTDQH